MRKIFSKMWNDDEGIVALEYLLVATIVGLGLVVGLANVSIALNAELSELANAILTLDQGYAVVAQSSCGGSKSGTSTTDAAGGISYGNTGAASITTSQGTGAISVSTCF